MKYFNRGRNGKLQRFGGNARIQTFRVRPRFQAFRGGTRNVQTGRRFRGKQTSNSFRSGLARNVVGSRKRVIMRGGLLTVMTRKMRQDDDDEDEDDEPSVAEASSSSSGRKLVKATTSGIMVNVSASPSWNRRQQLENMEENEQVDSDNVEMLTLDDLPEVRKLGQGRAPRGDRDDQQSATKRIRPLSNRFRGRLDSPESDAGSMVLVTNLHGGVSEEDITELFGNVGPIVGSKFIQPGVALVTYVSADDALHACEVYNKRLLDGQAMYCAMFMQPSPQPKPPVAPMIAGYAGSSQAQWQPSPWPIHAVGESPIRFTVRLP